MSQQPTAEEIRATLDRMVASDAFSRSPQLGAFLRFVVEAVLQGTSDRIKGYTIGVEVLRRDANFDPQADPIVRVEATRLRRTLERYYSGPGADDAIIIDLPRGSYVPTFTYRETAASPAAQVIGWLRGALDRMAWPAVAIAAVIVLAAIAAVFIVRAPSTTNGPLVKSLAPGNGMPALAVEPLEVSGTPGALSPHALLEKIRDAFSRFDTVNLIVDPEKGRPTDYRLTGAIDYRADRNASVRFRLVDTASGKIVWSQSYDAPSGGEKAAEDEIVTALATSLLQSYGVIRSLDRAKQLASDTGDPRYRCVLQSAEALRSQAQVQYLRARSCLERLTVLDPSFAIGFSFLSVLYTREYYLSTGVPLEDAALLDQALLVARRGVELNPASSRAHVMLLVVLYARKDVTEAFAAADKALEINPYDMLTFAEYGGRLIMTGEIDRGMTMLRHAAGYSSILPSWHHFYMFLGAYLGGDMKTAAYHAGQITAEGYPNGHMAKALAAAAAGDAERARQESERLYELRPSWRDDPAAELGKFILQPDLLDRLVRDLAAARLGGRS